MDGPLGESDDQLGGEDTAVRGLSDTQKATAAWTAVSRSPETGGDTGHGLHYPGTGDGPRQSAADERRTAVEDNLPQMGGAAPR